MSKHSPKRPPAKKAAPAKKAGGQIRSKVLPKPDQPRPQPAPRPPKK